MFPICVQKNYFHFKLPMQYINYYELSETNAPNVVMREDDKLSEVKNVKCCVVFDDWQKVAFCFSKSFIGQVTSQKLRIIP